MFLHSETWRKRFSTWWNQTSFEGNRKIPNTAILLIHTWLTGTGAAHYATSSAFMCWSARSAFCRLFSLFPTSFPPQRSPAGRIIPLRILSVANRKWGTAVLGSGWFNLFGSIFKIFFLVSKKPGEPHRHSDTMWIHKHLLLIGNIPKTLREYEARSCMLWAIYCCRLQHWLPGKWLHSQKWTLSFKVHRCLWGAFTVKCYCCFPKDALRQRKQNQELQGSRLQTVNSWKQYVSHFYWKVFVGFHDCGSFWHVIELSARQSKALFALCVVCLVVGMGVSCIFTHGFPSVKGKWRGALGANTKTGGLGRDLEEHKHTGTRVNNRHLRKWWYGLF